MFKNGKCTNTAQQNPCPLAWGKCILMLGISRSSQQLACHASKVEPNTPKLYTFCGFTLRYFKLIRRQWFFVTVSVNIDTCDCQQMIIILVITKRKKPGQVKSGSPGQAGLFSWSCPSQVTSFTSAYLELAAMGDLKTRVATAGQASSWYIGFCCSRPF